MAAAAAAVIGSMAGGLDRLGLSATEGFRADLVGRFKPSSSSSSLAIEQARD